jgi:hypothetical protein
MDAWETLLVNSTLDPIGFDAWEHLNAQEGGGGTIPPIIGTIILGGITYMDISTTLTSNIDTVISMNVTTPSLTMELGEQLSMNVETDNVSIDI